MKPTMEAACDVMAVWEYFFAAADGFSVGWLVTSRGEASVDIQEENKEVRRS